MQPDKTAVEETDPLLNSDKQYKICSAKVEPYEVDNPNFKYLSDHLSVTTTVEM